MKNRILFAFAIAMLVTAGVSGNAWAVAAGGEGYVYLNRAYPDNIGNAGPVRLTISGEGLDKVESIKLLGNSGAVEIPGTDLKVLEKGQLLVATFDVTGSAEDSYEIAADRHVNGELVRSVMYFHVYVKPNDHNQGLWAALTGATRVRYGTTTEYRLLYGHTNTNNLQSAIIVLAIPKGLEYTLGFNPDDYRYKYGPVSLPPPPSSIEADKYVIIPLYLENVPNYALPPLSFTVKWGSTSNDYRVRVWWAGSTGVAYDPIWGTNP